ncbi:hypothetical protein BD779DRAFT_1469100 [Infundibulicybe gibba]|nr:hypothetical protein BD779DRAFT_1469100 [Infundibulicybe gibba]
MPHRQTIRPPLLVLSQRPHPHPRRHLRPSRVASPFRVANPSQPPSRPHSGLRPGYGWVPKHLLASRGRLGLPKDPPASTTPATQAVALLTVDNGFQLYHNGQLIAANIDTDTPPGWQMATAVHIDLDPNSNVFAIQAHNSPADTDPNGNSSAGLLASIQVSYADGTTAIISSDTTWRAAQPIPSGFQLPSFNDTQWQLATALAKYGFGPWATQVTIPPSYNFTTR